MEIVFPFFQMVHLQAMKPMEEEQVHFTLPESLMFGTIMGNLLILNEGARGKWTIMIPTIAGLHV